jgi:hypothetical protein
MEVDVALDFADGAPRFGELLASLEALLERSILEPSQAELARAVPPHPSFGSLRGIVILDGAARRLDAVARVGISFVGLGPEKFVSRRMLWAFVSGADGYQALELRALELDAAPGPRIAHVLQDGGWSEAEVASLELETASPYSPPANIAASLRFAQGGLSLEGVPDTFMTLSRPGPDGTRIHTSLGFANYRVNGASGVGMYEYSRRVGEPGANAPEPDDEQT